MGKKRALTAASPQPLREDKSGKIPDQRIPRLAFQPIGC